MSCKPLSVFKTLCAGLLLSFSISLTLSAFAADAHQAVAEVESFALPTEDGLATLNGQIDFPAGLNKQRVPLVLMVPGTGLFDRDVDFGSSSGPDSLIFKSLSQALNSRGIATLRYDYRGVSCSFKTMPACPDCQSEQRVEHYFKQCVDNKVRAGVTPANIRSDIAQLYRWAFVHSRVEPKQMLALGHSEGSIHLAHLVKAKQITPQGLIMMGGLAESPSELIHWQSVGRVVDAMMSLDQNQDQTLSNEEITAHASENDLLKLFPLQSLLSPEGSWTHKSLNDLLENQYQQLKKNTLAAADTDPFGEGNYIQASMAWWKMFYTDQPAPASLLVDYPHPVIYHLGTVDSQVNLERQQATAAALPAGHHLRFEVYPERGHSLGVHALLGPMAPDSQTRLLDSIQELLKAD